MKQLSQIIALLSATAVLSTTVATTTLQCKEDEALLEVTYTLSEDEWKEILPGDDPYQYPILSVQPSGNYGMFNSSTIINYENYTILVDYTACTKR